MLAIEAVPVAKIKAGLAELGYNVQTGRRYSVRRATEIVYNAIEARKLLAGVFGEGIIAGRDDEYVRLWAYRLVRFASGVPSTLIYKESLDMTNADETTINPTEDTMTTKTKTKKAAKSGKGKGKAKSAKTKTAKAAKAGGAKRAKGTPSARNQKLIDALKDGGKTIEMLARAAGCVTAKGEPNVAAVRQKLAKVKSAYGVNWKSEDGRYSA